MSTIINSFPGYHYEEEFINTPEGNKFLKHNYYHDIDVGFGGYVYANPGMYGRTICFDVSGMHPASLRALNHFGEYTKNFGDIVDARIAIKHKDYDAAKKMFGGKLNKYLDDPAQAKQLAQALKIAVNSCYGLTSANFPNPMRDPRNKNNIVALRGALFMVNLKEEVEKRGFTVAHIKTDSIKVVEPDEEIANFIMEYGKKYGYNFEIEHIFEKICLVNNAVYIGKLAKDDPDHPGEWTATGTQFAVPYVFKHCFSREPITIDDMCETKEVKGQLYLDFDENLPEGDHDYHFVGKIGRFTPIKPGHGGGVLYRYDKDKYSAATGTKGYRWMESELIIATDNKDIIDKSYYENLVNEAIEEISKYGDYEWFVSNDETDLPDLKANEKDLIITDTLPESFNTNN